MKQAERLGFQSATRPRDARVAGHIDASRWIEQPLYTLQQATQHFPRGGLRVQRKGDDVVNDDVSREASFLHAGALGFGKNLTNNFKRKELRNHAETDVVGDPDSRGQRCNSTGHFWGLLPKQDRMEMLLSEQYWD
jgi:hypothetical protein